MLPFFHTQKVVQIVKKNHDNWFKTKTVIQSLKMSKKCPKKSKFLVSKYIKVLELKKTKTFLNKGTKHLKNYIGLNSKNKNIKGGGSP